MGMLLFLSTLVQALTAEQTKDIVEQGTGLTKCEAGKFLTIGTPSGGNGRIFAHTPQGYPFGLLVHDMVDRFLLHFFTHASRAVQFPPQRGSIRFRPLICTYAPWGVHVGVLAKSTKRPTRKILPFFFVSRHSAHVNTRGTFTTPESASHALERHCTSGARAELDGDGARGKSRARATLHEWG